MESYSSKFRIAGIFSLISGALIHYVSLEYGIFVILLGLLSIYISNLKPSELRNKKVLILIFGIIMVFINIISGILIIIGYDELTNYLHNNKDPIDEKEKVSDEVKKIDLLLKLGTFMVLASGVLFATTSWNTISNIFKLVFLLVLGTVFLFLSLFVDKRLNIKKTTFAYWLLSMSFYFFIWIGVCYFEVFGKIFSYTGLLKDLAYLTTYLLASILLFITSLKFDMKKLLYIVYFGLYISIYYFIKYIGIDDTINMIILSLINIVCNIILINQKDSILRKDIKVISYMMILFNTIPSTNSLYVFILSIINILNIFILLANNEDILENIIGFLSIYIYLFISTINQNIISEKNFLFVLMFSIVGLFVKLCKEKDKGFYITNQIIYHITIISFYISSLFFEEKMLIPISIVYLLSTIINSLNINKLETKSIDYYLVPLPVTLLAISIIRFISKSYFDIPVKLGMVIMIFVYLLLSFIGRNKKEYMVLSLITIIFSTLVLIDSEDLLSSILLLVSTIILFIKNYFKEDDNSKQTCAVSYILLLISIDILFRVLPINKIIGCILVLVIYVLLLFLFKKRRSLEIITNILMVLPMYQLIDNYVDEYELSMVLENALEFYILYILVKYIFNKDKLKNIISLIGIILILSELAFETGIYIGIYVGIVGIIVMLIGYFDKHQKGLFQLGIIVTIINILYQLGDVWESIPFWLYLLIVGLGLIGFVTYKELNKDKKKDNQSNNNEVKEIESSNDICYCSQCGNPTKKGSKFCSKCGRRLK